MLLFGCVCEFLPSALIGCTVMARSMRWHCGCPANHTSEQVDERSEYDLHRAQEHHERHLRWRHVHHGCRNSLLQYTRVTGEPHRQCATRCAKSKPIKRRELRSKFKEHARVQARRFAYHRPCFCGKVVIRGRLSNERALHQHHSSRAVSAICV